ncbi:hypothetical protein Bca4012_019119 [Brassica carinata]
MKLTDLRWRRWIDGEIVFWRMKKNKRDFRERPTKERDTFRCGPVVTRHVRFLTKPKNTNLSSAPLFSLHF